MKKSLMKKLTAALGFLALVLVFTVIPGGNAEAATLKLDGEAAAVESGYHLVKMPKTGYIIFSTAGMDQNGPVTDQPVAVQLYNRAKKPISYKREINAYSADVEDQAVSYAVKSGYYYIRVTGNAQYYITSTVGKALTEKSGSKKSKAVTISNKKYRKGLVLNTDSKKKYDWYKFTLKKKQKVFIRVLQTDMNLQFKLYSNARVSSKTKSSFLKGKRVTMPKGTYYIRVEKTKSYYGGAYAVGVNYTFKGNEL